MALPQTVVAGQAGHLADHDELHELLAAMDAYVNVAGFASLQAAHDALPGAGGVLYFPPGHQLTPTATTTISKPCVILGSPDAKLIQGGNTFYNLLNVSAVDRFWLVGLHLDGRLDQGRTADGDLLSVNGACPDLRVTGCRFTQCHGGIALGTGAHTDVRIERNRIANSQYAGIYAPGPLSRAWISDNYIDTTQDAGILFGNPGAGLKQSDVIVARNQIRNYQRNGGAGKAGIQTIGAGSSSEEWHTRFTIVGNSILATSQPGDLVGIGLDQINDSTIAGNTITNVVGGGAGADSEGIVLCGPRNLVCGNRVRNHEAGGICLLSYGNGAQIADVTVCCNDVRGQGVGQGLNWVATDPAGNSVTGLLVNGNRFTNCGHGIQTYNNGGTLAGSNNFVVGNNLVGNATAAASFVANSGQVTASNNPTI